MSDEHPVTVIDPADFGVVADGLTDDRVAWQRCYDDTTERPPGAYEINMDKFPPDAISAITSPGIEAREIKAKPSSLIITRCHWRLIGPGRNA